MGRCRHPVTGAGSVAGHIGHHPLGRSSDHLSELSDAAGDAARCIHHQDDGVGPRIVDGVGELFGQDIQRGCTGQCRKQVGVAEHRAGDGQQGNIATLSHCAAVLQGLTLPCLQGLRAFMFPTSNGGDGLQHVRGDGPGLA